MKFAAAFSFSFFAFAFSAWAQGTGTGTPITPIIVFPTPPAPVGPPGQTTLTLNLGGTPVPQSHVTVPVGERLIVSVNPPSTFGTLQWRKNGLPIAGATANTFTFDGVRTADAGTYDVVTVPPPGSLIASLLSQTLFLGVGPVDRFLNLSARGWVGGPDQPFIVGLVVAAADGRSKKIIVRAIGPTLTQFGVANPLAVPVIKIFDATGKPYVNGYVYPTVVGGPTYNSDLADSLARCGAFPLSAGTKDVTDLRPFVAGNYSVQVTSADGATGNVLLEIYEVP